MKALFESHAYLKNPSATDIILARQQAMFLDGIVQVVNGQPPNPFSNPSTSTTATTTSAGSSINNADENTTSCTSSPTGEDAAKNSEK